MVTAPTASTISRLLLALDGGNSQVFDELMPLVYDELKIMARDQLRRERPNHTLEPTALVHEAYLKLVDQRIAGYRSRGHFFGIAAQAMRRILTDYARRRRAAKRDGGKAATLDEDLIAIDDSAEEVLAIDDALQRLGRLSERQARVVELRYFGGLTLEEAAEAVGVSLTTAKRDWLAAKAWLHRELGDGGGRDQRPIVD